MDSLPGTTSSGTILTGYVAAPATVVGVNDAGDVVLNTNNYLLSSGSTYSVGTLPNASGYTAIAMSDNGQIVGSGEEAPVMWTPITSSGQITGYNNPTTLGGGNPGNVSSVNNAGEAAARTSSRCPATRTWPRASMSASRPCRCSPAMRTTSARHWR